MAQAIAHVKDAEQMITSARLYKDRILCALPTSKQWLIPLEELKFAAKPQGIHLPNPYVLKVILRDKSREELPWDYLRAFVDPEYRARAETEGRWGQRLLGERLKRSGGRRDSARSAAKAGISRVTIARLEAGEQSPHYETLRALSQGLGLPLERLWWTTLDDTQRRTDKLKTAYPDIRIDHRPSSLGAGLAE